MLPLGRERKVLGDHRPAITRRSYIVFSSIEYWLNGENHARFQIQTFTRVPIMKDLRLIVVNLADAKSVAEREAFAEFLASLPTGIKDLDAEQRKAFALESFAAMTDSLVTGRAL